MDDGYSAGGSGLVSSTYPLNTATNLADRARNMLRDFPVFFEEVHQPLTTSTIKLSRMMVATLDIRSVEDNVAVPVSNYTVDTRNGVVRFSDLSDITDGVTISGYYYEWFLPEDLEYYAEIAMSEHTHNRTDIAGFADFSTEEKHATAVLAVVFALGSLMTELALDIDVSTPEGMMIPAHMRFQQIQQLFQYWSAEYAKRASLLNLGLERIDIFDLRRISRLTNRYVPQFRGREIDDPRPPVRVFPEIPAEVAAPEEGGSEGAGAYNPDYGLDAGGWTTLGTSGG
jgi:hypothetical protein